jgi:2-polyprenyl-6-methoxyphenol hydroxylase-like FAD-dependent oxidoreductase
MFSRTHKNSASRSRNNHYAIVIGGSLAGLLTARVLADHFAHVTIIERDVFTPDPRPRPGVPQSRHIHALLPRGLQIVDRLFPGIRQQLESLGAIPLDIGNDVSWLTPEGWGIKFRSGIEGLSFTRDLLDHTIRARIAQVPNINLVEGRKVVGLLRAQSGAIFGVRTRQRGTMLQSDSDQDFLGDLVVIAAGRQHAIARWFAEVGIEQPALTTINAHIGYASRLYRVSQSREYPWKALIHQAAPPSTHRSGLIFPVEGDRWLVTLIGADRDYPPTTETGFLEFARHLRSPQLLQAIRQAKPLTPIVSYRATENRQHHFHHIANWPAGLIVIGDAACAFNPVYGQGMTTAALEAEMLHSLLGEHGNSHNLAQTFQRKLPQITRGPWTLATSADLRFRSVEGAQASPITRLMHWYVDRVLRLGTTSVFARRRFLEVQGMLKDATAILHPDILARVLLNQFGRKSNTMHPYLEAREHTHLPEKYRRKPAEVSHRDNMFTETGNVA